MQLIVVNIIITSFVLVKGDVQGLRCTMRSLKGGLQGLQDKARPCKDVRRMVLQMSVCFPASPQLRFAPHLHYRSSKQRDACVRACMPVCVCI